MSTSVIFLDIIYLKILGTLPKMLGTFGRFRVEILKISQIFVILKGKLLENDVTSQNFRACGAILGKRSLKPLIFSHFQRFGEIFMYTF